MRSWPASAVRVYRTDRPSRRADTMPAALARRPAPGRSDPAGEVLERAARHGDEHVIKFTDTAVEVYARTSDPGALAAALRAAELITRP